MCKSASSTLNLLLLLIVLAPVRAQHQSNVIERGKKRPRWSKSRRLRAAASGSGFCIDKSGLFITNSHVVRRAGQGKDDVRLVVDIGLKTQRSIRAKVLRTDDGLDLALLKVDADAGLSALELGKEDSLVETSLSSRLVSPSAAKRPLATRCTPT